MTLEQVRKMIALFEEQLLYLRGLEKQKLGESQAAPTSEELLDVYGVTPRSLFFTKVVVDD